jgi:glucose/arabinose dehydrogenase
MVNAVVDQDGKKVVKPVIKGLRMATGVAFHDHTLYVVDIDKVYAWVNPEANLDSLGAGKIVYDDFPPYTPHGWKYITVGQNGELFIPVGPPCNECLPPSGTSQVRRINPDNGNAELWAIGVRNSVGGAVDPRTGKLWFSENARDWLGDDIPSDKLNLVSNTGEDFGYPYCHQGDILDPVYGKGHSCSEFAPPVLKLGPHVAPLGMKFYTGNQFPSEYSGNLFIAEHGSWNRHQKNGYRIERVQVNPDGTNASQEEFATGFWDGKKILGRPSDVIVAPDGSLLVADDQAGAIYQISYIAK